MKKRIIKKVITKHGFFDRELLFDLTKKNNFRRFLTRKFYRKFLKAVLKKPKVILKKPIHALERMGQAYEPINLFSKIKFKFKK